MKRSRGDSLKNTKYFEKCTLKQWDTTLDHTDWPKLENKENEKNISTSGDKRIQECPCTAGGHGLEQPAWTANWSNIVKVGVCVPYGPAIPNDLT